MASFGCDLFDVQRGDSNLHGWQPVGSGIVFQPDCQQRRLVHRRRNRELCAAEVQELYTLTQLTLPVTPRIAASGDSVTLTWNTIPGRAYQAQYATTLSPANWQPLADVVAATFSAAASDSIDPVQNRFYRILLQP